MRTPSKFVALVALVVVTVVLTPCPAAASAGGPVFAGYWGQFLDHWGTYFKQQSGVVMKALRNIAPSLPMRSMLGVLRYG